MHIGELASRTGASAKAIRLYEEQGLLGPVPRQGVYRLYGERHLQQVLLIRQAQSVGFRLAELHPLLAGGEEPDWPELYQRLQGKRAALRAEIRRLQHLDAQLGRIGAEIHACIADQPQADQALCAAEPAQRSALLHEA
ncbi:MerR family transcriptional regulator [Pseudomonas tohonis]|uniref:MerR family transcriptional regulator n=1 Tax=Pseudomonas tohonis TaxID=2725477 RepID=UPI001F2F1720|nr:MerR family transcriptional regulator [Pseudomonas tohonis]